MSLQLFSQMGGPVVPAWSYLLACTPMTAPKEHLLLRDAQAQKKPKAELLAVREVENHLFLPQNPVLMPYALKGNLAMY